MVLAVAGRGREVGGAVRWAGAGRGRGGGPEASPCLSLSRGLDKPEAAGRPACSRAHPRLASAHACSRGPSRRAAQQCMALGCSSFLH